MIKNKKLCALAMVLTLSIPTAASASSWSINLGRWSADREIATMTKTTTNGTYYMAVSSVGGAYDSVEHWTEGVYGGNYSSHSITKEGKNDSPSSTASKGDAVTLNVCNPISTQVLVSASGSWSPN